MHSSLIFTSEPVGALKELISGIDPTEVVVIADENTSRHVYPLLADGLPAGHILLTVPPGEGSKNIASAGKLWDAMAEAGVNRHSLVVNVGGGMVSDLGGFTAATFMRGVPFINVPTTPLGAVDAAVGGKTGVNIGVLKNQVGVFAQPHAVVVSALPYSTLSEEELLSGYGEMLKHALLEGEDALSRILKCNPVNLDANEMLELVEGSVQTKLRITRMDPFEKGLRKTLNLGHTAGHAYESLALEKGLQVSHGRAVAWGLATELILSHMQLGFPSSWLHALTIHIKELYGMPPVGCDDYPRLINIMGHDKKNGKGGKPSFVLLKKPGEPTIDCHPDSETISTAIDITRDLLC